MKEEKNTVIEDGTKYIDSHVDLINVGLQFRCFRFFYWYFSFTKQEYILLFPKILKNKH